MNAAHSADPVIDRAAASPPDAQGGFFGPPSRPRFGWLHRPAALAAGVGLVIVPPFGYEGICAYRSVRHLAEVAARRGAVALRFDPDGWSDSAGDDLDPDRLEAWLASIADACDLMRGAGADRIVLAGIRLGALLAALAAERRDDIAGLVAIAAPASGKAWLREGRALQLALDLAAPPAGTVRDESVQELVGFALTEQTRADIGRIDLTRAVRPAAPAVLLLDRDDLPGNDAWAAHLRALGAQVEQRRLPGYVEMVLDAQNAKVPREIVAAAADFLAAAAPTTTAPPPAPPALRAANEILAREGTVTEECVAIDACLNAILTRPVAAIPRRAVILLNAGAIAHIGPNRLYVTLARRLAAQGDLVLRLDQSGLGDSRAREGAQEHVVYGEHAVGDVADAVAWVRRAGVEQVVLAGLCSGAYHAFKAALAGQPVDRIIAINPLTFHYKPGMPLDFAAFRIAAEAARYKRSLRSGASWKKLLRGEVDVGRAVQMVARRLLAAVAGRGRDVLRHLGVPLHEDLGSELLALARRGVAMEFIFAGGDPGVALLADEAGSVVRRLAGDGKLTIRTIDGAGHTFTPRWSQPLLLDAIVEALR
ncbi:MAG: alpha/beta hydrolase [Rudaea sp.]|uniref:serine aminopeptidase domain-containing protein n=1 Tax=Rudaea sp. TaxID=2136325 RepID=UPI0039E41C10